MIYINLDFKTGIGNFYVDTIECMEYASILKDRGYNVHLLFSSVNNKYIEHIKFDEIYRDQEFVMFDSISNLRLPYYTESTFNNCKSYNLKKRWRVFSDTDLNHIPVPSYENLGVFINKKKFLPFRPVFKQIIYDKRDEFLYDKNDFDFIHLRTRNAKIGNQDPSVEKYSIKESHAYTEEITEKIFESIKRSSRHFYIGSNDRFFLDRLSVLPNVFKYPFKHLDIFMNDYDYYKHVKKLNIDREIVLERFYDNLAEFISLEKASNYYQSTSLCWVSHFLAYALINNQSSYKFEQIDTHNIINIQL